MASEMKDEYTAGMIDVGKMAAEATNSDLAAWRLALETDYADSRDRGERAENRRRYVIVCSEIGKRRRERQAAAVEEGVYSSADDVRKIVGDRGLEYVVEVVRDDGRVKVGLAYTTRGSAPDTTSATRIFDLLDAEQVYALVRKLRFAVSVLKGG